MLMAISAIGAMKEIDPKDMTEDTEKMMELWNNAVNTWISKNPDKAAEISGEVVEALKEYEQLMGRKHP